MRIIGIILLLISSPLLADNKEQVSVATHFYEALKENNIAKARKHISDKKNLLDDGETSFDLDKYYFLNTITNNNEAIIKTSIINKLGTLTYITVLDKVKKEWKVNFQKTMINMIGIIVGDNQIKNTAQIIQVVKPGEKYLVKFLTAPVFSRVCTVEEIQTWLLFQNQDEANKWVVARSSTDAPPGNEPVPPKKAIEGVIPGNGQKKSAQKGDEKGNNNRPTRLAPANDSQPKRFEAPTDETETPDDVA